SVSDDGRCAAVEGGPPRGPWWAAAAPPWGADAARPWGGGCFAALAGSLRDLYETGDHRADEVIDVWSRVAAARQAGAPARGASDDGRCAAVEGGPLRGPWWAV